MDVTRWTPTRRRNLLDHCIPSSSTGGGGDQTHCGPEHREGGPSTGISQNRMKRRCGETGHCVYPHRVFTHWFKLLPGSSRPLTLVRSLDAAARILSGNQKANQRPFSPHGRQERSQAFLSI